MCRNIKTLFNFDPPATKDEIYASSLQYVRKVSGFRKPSKHNETTFETAINEIAQITRQLLNSLETDSPSKNREEEAAKAKLRAQKRFGSET
ncbi:MAG: DUF2277 domain-containing protein [Calditrichaeota bacterium]|nr:MAG: DUF2277 domain-containing protein [Calditrichota bacterium]